MVAHLVQARMDAAGDQLAEITVDHGYRPQFIVAQAGLPLRLVFHRVDDESCSERVVFSSPRLERRLASHADTTIVLPAQPPGEVRFTCAMGRYRGQIEFRRAGGRSILVRFSNEASRLESPLGTAVVLWICSLPLIALLAVLALDATAAIAAAGAALVAWVGGCLWAFRRSARST